MGIEYSNAWGSINESWTIENEFRILWLKGCDAFEEKRLGLAMRIMSDAINLANDKVSPDNEILYRLKRDLANGYLDVGDFDSALPLLIETKSYYRIARYYISLGDYRIANIWYELQFIEGQFKPYEMFARTFFLKKDYKGAVDTCELFSTEFPKRLISRTELDMVLYALSQIMDGNILLEHYETLKSMYPYLMKAICEKYGNIESAIIHTEKFKSVTFEDKLKRKLFTPRQIFLKKGEIPDLSYSEEEIMAVFEEARNQRTKYCSQHLSPGFEFLLLKKVSPPQEFPVNWRELYDLKEEEKKRLDWNTYIRYLVLFDKKMTGDDLAQNYRWLIKESSRVIVDFPDELVSACQIKLNKYHSDFGIELLDFFKEQIINNPEYDFYENTEHVKMIQNLIKDIDSEIRKKLDLPEKGEGWVSESIMVSMLKKKLFPCQVIREASPRWLDKMRFDAFIPDLNLAVEYQGEQHFRHLEHFGTEDDFKDRIIRDKIKLQLSITNGVMIEYIRFDENIEKRVDEIIQKFS